MKSNAVSIKANRKRVLVYGYLNLNLGDDLFFRTLAERYPSVDFYVFSDVDYDAVVRRENFHTIRRNRINRIFASHLPYQFALYGFDAIVYIGGSIFIERGESGSCTTLRNLGKLHAKFPKLPIHIIGSNYGPERTAAFRREVERVFESEAVLIANRNLTAEEREVLDELLFRIESERVSRGKKYLLMNIPTAALDEAVKILPAMRSPTVMPLAAEGWCSLHSVVDATDLWDKVRQLKAIGAEGILVLTLDKIIA